LPCGQVSIAERAQLVADGLGVNAVLLSDLGERAAKVVGQHGEMTYRDVRELRGPERFGLDEVAESRISPGVMSGRYMQRSSARAIRRAERDRDAA
jgi:hypothetical protein